MTSIRGQYSEMGSSTKNEYFETTNLKSHIESFPKYFSCCLQYGLIKLLEMKDFVYVWCKYLFYWISFIAFHWIKEAICRRINHHVRINSLSVLITLRRVAWSHRVVCRINQTFGVLLSAFVIQNSHAKFGLIRMIPPTRCDNNYYWRNCFNSLSSNTDTANKSADKHYREPCTFTIGFSYFYPDPLLAPCA